jgi:hypothetical protein
MLVENYCKLRSLSYLGLRSTTASFTLVSKTYNILRKLKIRRRQLRGGSTPFPGTIINTLFSMAYSDLRSALAFNNPPSGHKYGHNSHLAHFERVARAIPFLPPARLTLINLNYAHLRSARRTIDPLKRKVCSEFRAPELDPAYEAGGVGASAMPPALGFIATVFHLADGDSPNESTRFHKDV